MWDTLHTVEISRQMSPVCSTVVYVRKGVNVKEKPSIELTGVVEKVIPSPHPAEPEKAQIVIEGAENLYREIRIENSLTDQNGNTVHLKTGADVDITVGADLDETTPDRKRE